MTKHINNLAAEVDWGVPFKKALEIFGKKIQSVPIKRAVTTIIQTYKVGGRISDTLSAVGRSLVEIDKIRSERTASVHAQIITSYLIYFVFIFILVVLQTFLIPALSPPENIAGIPGLVESTTPISQELYKNSFVNFILIQGFFAGLVTGKMAEGSIVAGFKHSVLLIVVGYTIFSFSSQFQFSLF
jgi:flagellar protein FlaJ